MSSAKPTESPGTPLKSSPTSGAESPTTARPLDFDDEPQETGTAGSEVPNTPAMPNLSSSEDIAPPKPPRPQNPLQQAEATLKEAFPSIDPTIVKAVLTASGGKVEPAFNALLGMSDPSAQAEPTPPPQPPRPRTESTSTPQTQLEADELYARQLAEHYNDSRSYGRSREPTLSRPRKETGLKPNELYDDREHSFIDDDLPAIKENIRKGFLETQSKVNQWVANFKKKLDGEEEEEEEENSFNRGPAAPAQGYDGPQNYYGARRSGDSARRSGDYNRYDADPRVLGDDFAQMELNENTAPQRRSTRPLANPDLFKPTPTVPKSDSRKVSFQENHPEDTDLYKSSPKALSQDRQPSPAGKASKWQPLSTVEPSPITENDPFSLGDSDDDREAKTKDIKSEDAERLKKATAEAMSEDIGPGSKKNIQLAERTGS